MCSRSGARKIMGILCWAAMWLSGAPAKWALQIERAVCPRAQHDARVGKATPWRGRGLNFGDQTEERVGR